MPALRSPGLQTFRDANSPVGGLSLTCQAGEETMPLKKGKWELIVWWDEPIPPLEKVTLPRAPQCVPGLHVSFTDNVLSSPQRTHNAPAHDPNLAQTAPQPPRGGKTLRSPCRKAGGNHRDISNVERRRGKYVDWCCKQPPINFLLRCINLRSHSFLAVVKLDCSAK